MSTDISTESIIRISPMFRFQWEEVQQSYVILYPEGMVKLSGSAGEILKRVDGQTSVQNIIDDLQQQFGETDLKADVLNFLEVAEDNGWIQSTD